MKSMPQVRFLGWNELAQIRMSQRDRLCSTELAARLRSSLLLEPRLIPSSRCDGARLGYLYTHTHASSGDSGPVLVKTTPSHRDLCTMRGEREVTRDASKTNPAVRRKARG